MPVENIMLLAMYFLCIGLVILVNVQVATSVRMVARKFKSICNRVV